MASVTSWESAAPPSPAATGGPTWRRHARSLHSGRCAIGVAPFSAGQKGSVAQDGPDKIRRSDGRGDPEGNP